MPIAYKSNWEETRQRYAAWFNRDYTDRPIFTLYRQRETPLHAPLTEEPFRDAEDRYTNADKNFAHLSNVYAQYEPVAEAFPQFSMNLGAGSMALYLGSQPVYADDTLWYTPVIEDYAQALPLRYDPENPMWKRHLAIIDRQLELVKDTDMRVCIPDIIENIDILAALRGPQETCFDLYDYYDEVKRALGDIADVYMRYYDTIYERVKGDDGFCAYTAFNLLGPGKTAKIQCDFAALLSPAHFDDLILPSLRRQCREIPNTLFHLDGPECLVHVDSLMTIDELDALQWTPGARNPGAGDECWFGLYEKVFKAGKGLWLDFWDLPPDEALQAADHLVHVFGPKGFFFQFQYMDAASADRILHTAETAWRISG